MNIIASAIFCDDIRQEVAGKVTLVGCYPGQMVVLGDFPVFLPKIGVAIQLRIPRPKILDDVITFNVFPPHDRSHPVMSSKFTIPRLSDDQIASTQRAEQDGEFIAQFNIFMSSAAVELKEAGFFRVRAVYGEEQIRVGDLHVLRAPQPLRSSAAS